MGMLSLCFIAILAVYIPFIGQGYNATSHEGMETDI